MLNFLRKRGNIKKIMWGLAILIIPAFVLWGSGSAIRSKGMPKYAGEIFGKKISFSQYDESYTASRNQALLMYGDNFSRIAQYLNLEEQAWERLILLYQAKKEKIKTPDQEVVEFIKGLPLFQSEGGFDQKRYNFLLDYVLRSNPRDFEEQIRQALTIGKLENTVIQAVLISDEEIESEYRKENEQAQAKYIFFDPQQFQEEIHPSFEQLKDYYQTHQAEFKKPEQVNVEYIGLYFEQDVLKPEIGEQEIKDYYQGHPEEFSAQDGQDQEKTKPLEEVKTLVQEKLAQEKIRTRLEEEIWQLSDRIAEKPEMFKELAKQKKLEIKETGWFEAQKLIPEIGFSYEFLNTAFSLKVGEISNPLETPKGFFIIRVKEKKAPFVPSLEEIKAQVQAALVKQKSRELAKDKGEEVLEKLKQLAQKEKLSFDQAAGKLSLTVRETEPFSRKSYISGIGQSQSFSYSAFGLKPGALSNLVEVPNGYCIVSLKELIPIDQEKFAQEKELFGQQLLASKKQTHLKIWLNLLKQKANLVNHLEKLKNTAP